MYTIKANIISELVIKNSRFITIIKKITEKDEVNKYLAEIKKEYPKATHYCYAYIIDDFKKTSDDGEPGGTAGMPILNVLEKESLTNILVVVVRYFGGIKLGAGGLVRAYSKAVKTSINDDDLIELIDAYKIKVTITYEENDQFEYLVKNAIIIEKEFSGNITYILSIPKDEINKLKNYKYEIIDEVKIEKKSTN